MVQELGKFNESRVVLKPEKVIVESAEFESQHAHMADCRAKAADEIKDQKPARAPHILQYSPEHPKREHIREDMPEGQVHVVRVTMHEQVGKWLPPPEQRRCPIVKPEIVAQVNALFAQNKLNQHHQYIDDNDIFYNRGQHTESAGPEVGHDAKVMERTIEKRCLFSIHDTENLRPDSDSPYLWR